MSNYTAVYTGLWLLLLMFLWRRWRQYRIDALRQDLFSLRDQLFDFAAAGNIAFESPAYQVSRAAINSLIRFAHRITASRVLLLLLVKQLKGYEAEDVLIAITELPEGDVRTRIAAIHANVLFAIAVHLLKISPLLCAFLALFLLQLLVKGAIRKTSDVVVAFARHLSVDLLENMAIEVDSGLSVE